MRKIDWSNYYADMTIGVKQFLVKDDMTELPKARNIHRRYEFEGKTTKREGVAGSNKMI